MLRPLLLVLLLTACGEPDKPDDSAPPSSDDTAIEPTDLDGDGYSSEIDCDDDDPDVHPDADERCNDVDDDCDGDVDEDPVDPTTWYTDADGDGWGDPDDSIQACEQPEGTVVDGTDCDDDEPEINPDADEICWDDIDNDCDDEVDEPCVIPDDYPLEGADAVLYGPFEGGRAGWDVASAGDVNADGYDDLLIGAPEAAWEGSELEGSYVAGSSTGAVMLVHGPVSGDLDLTDADAWLQGTYDEEGHISLETGWSVAGVGDTNGDGYDDILVGAPDYKLDSYGKLWHYGMAALFLGPITGLDHTWAADATWTGGYYSLTGYDVAGAGDVNGDGLDDVLIGAPGGDLTDLAGGEAYVFLGSTEATLSSENRLATLYTDSYADSAGNAVHSAGDVDGDGLDDIIVGAYYESSTVESGGAAYLVLSPVSGDMSLQDAHLTVWGDSDYQHVGQALTDAGDLDGDGYDDFVLGVTLSHDLAEYGGAAYVFYGDAHGGQSGDVVSESASATLSGDTYCDLAGGSVSSAGDVDGDGKDDILIGRSWYAKDNFEEGLSWLVLGPITGSYALDDVAHTRFEGTDVDDQAGVAVSSAGDVDADGLSDILIGAPGDDTYGDNAGAAYLILAAGL